MLVGLLEVGRLEGSRVVGFTVGVTDGDNEGLRLGLAEGREYGGNVVGAFEGRLAGDKLIGAVDGDQDGSSVGNAVEGLRVGAIEGTRVVGF